jgi:hypothetical protein
MLSPVWVAIENAGFQPSTEETLPVEPGCMPCAIMEIAAMRRNNPAMRQILVMPFFTSPGYIPLIINLSQ